MWHIISHVKHRPIMSASGLRSTHVRPPSSAGRHDVMNNNVLIHSKSPSIIVDPFVFEDLPFHTDSQFLSAADHIDIIWRTDLLGTVQHIIFCRIVD
jgi:hypothetical protein